MQDTNTELAAKRAEKLIVSDSSSIAYLMDTARFEHSWRIAKTMAAASLIPDHLRLDKNKQPLAPEVVAANCFLIVNQSLRWGFDPFAVAPETYVVGGKLAYQGKLVAAAVNALAGIEGRLSYEHFGQAGTDGFGVVVSARFPGDAKDRTVSVTVGQCKTTNDMWKRDPEQKLIYTGVVKWARRHCPEVVLGIASDDDEAPPMRTAEGRVVGEESPPEVVAAAAKALTAAAEAQTAAPARRSRAAKTPDAIETAPAPQEAACEPQESEAEERIRLVGDIKMTMAEKDIKLSFFDADLRRLGVLAEGQGLNGRTIDELRVVHARREEATSHAPKGGEA